MRSHQLRHFFFPAPPLEDNEPLSKTMPQIKKEQFLLKSYYGGFPTIHEVTDRNRPEIREAERLTQSLVSKRPSANLADQTLPCHIVKGLLGGKDSDVIFFDSSKGARLYDASANLVDISFNERPFILELDSLNGIAGRTFTEQEQNDLTIFQRLNDRIQRGQSHPILEYIRPRLAETHGVPKERIQMMKTYHGSAAVVYEVLVDKQSIKNSLSTLTQSCHKYFPRLKKMKIHPLLHRPCFDVTMFDARGNKLFGSTYQTHRVGPPGREKEYRTPKNWMRYGLNVLDKYEDQSWLHPFQDPGNWYRAYHGTGNASRDDFGNKSDNVEERFAPVDAMASIYKSEFRKARIHAYGEGVYCSPNPAFPEREGYVGEVEIDTVKGAKKYKCMLQVAVNPDGVKEGKADIWVVAEPPNIRPYGILIKEAGTDNSTSYDD